MQFSPKQAKTMLLWNDCCVSLSPKSRAEALTLNVMVLGGEDFGR